MKMPDPNEERFLAEASRNYTFLDLRIFREKVRMLEEFLKRLGLTQHETLILLQYMTNKLQTKITTKTILGVLDDRDKDK